MRTYCTAETVQTTCQIVIIYGVVVALHIYIVFIIGAARLASAYIYGVMYIYGGNIVQICSVLILDLTGSVGITAVILIGITVYYDLRCSLDYRSSRLHGSCRLNV